MAERLARRQLGILAVYCLVLFGFAMVSGRPLSLHESVLPQSAREMLADGDWIVPKKGDTPWLESPPLPQWITVSLASLFGRCDTEWVVRLGPTLVATLTTLMVAWMACLWFGRQLGFLAGFLFATTCQFTRYAWLAEDEIYLCGVITLAIAAFVRAEFGCHHRKLPGGWRFLWSSRPRQVVTFFFCLGFTNLVKGLMFGTVMAMVPIGLFLLMSRDSERIRRYVWPAGFLLFAAISLAWPVAAWMRYPDVIDVWRYDLGGRLDGSYVSMAEPWWYYPVNLLWMLLPWTLVIPAGMRITASRAIRERLSGERFLWCWALGIPLVFSLPHGKHHHYLLHGLAPWSILGAVGLVRVREWIRNWPARWRNPWNSLLTTGLPIVLVLVLLRDRMPVPVEVVWVTVCLIPPVAVLLSWATLHRNAGLAGATLFGVLACIYCSGHWLAGEYVDRHRQDVAFLKSVNDRLEPGQTLLVDMDIDPLVGFLHLFYLNDQAIPLHNLSFVLDDQIGDSEVFVVTPESRKVDLSRWGEVSTELRGWKTDRESELLPEQLTLFRLRYNGSATRFSSNQVRVSPMQAMHREDGPWLR